MTNAERENLRNVLKILRPYMKYDKETNIGCGSAREIQRSMVDLLQRAEQRGRIAFNSEDVENASLESYKKGLLRAAEMLEHGGDWDIDREGDPHRLQSPINKVLNEYAEVFRKEANIDST